MSKVALQPVIDGIKEAIALGDKPYLELRAPIQASIMRPSGEYRTKTLVGDEELLLNGVRDGKRSELIFEFEPVDATTEFKQVEFNDKVIAERFPEIADWVCEALGQSGAPSLKDAIKNHMRDHAKRQEQEEENRLEAEAVAEQKRHVDDETWGVF